MVIFIASGDGVKSSVIIGLLRELISRYPLENIAQGKEGMVKLPGLEKRPRCGADVAGTGRVQRPLEAGLTRVQVRPGRPGHSQEPHVKRVSSTQTTTLALEIW
jgi:hypothetical protein